MKIQNKIFLLLFSQLLAGLLACASSKTGLSAQDTSGGVSKEEIIGILSPTLRYESIETEKEIPAAKYQGEKVKESLLSQTRLILKKKGFKLSQNELYVPASIQQRQIELFQTAIPKNLLKDLQNVDSSFSNCILVIDLKVKVGSGGSWDPIFGSITSKNHSSILRAVLIDKSKNKVLWRNVVQLRDIPAYAKNNFLHAIETLFKTLK